MRCDLRCYAIIDPEVAGGHELPELCRMLAAGGVTLVQLRDKLSDTKPMIERASVVLPTPLRPRIATQVRLGTSNETLSRTCASP